MKTIRNIVVFIPAVLGILGFILMVPGAIISGNIAGEESKNHQPAFGYDLSNVKGDLDQKVGNLWATFGFVAAFVGLGAALMTIKFPVSFGKAILLDCIVVAFVCIAFNIFTLLALFLFIASGTFSLLQKRE